MTKQEALEIENKCDELMSKYIKEPCNMSMALSGRLKVSFGENYITLDKEYEGADYIKYYGFYEDLGCIIESVGVCIKENKELFERLIWSYNHCKELT